jgi:hypothetical protein
MSSPLIITEDDVDFVGRTLEKAIMQVADRLVKEGVRIG